MKKLSLVLGMLIVLLLSGSACYTPAIKHHIITTRQFNTDFDKTWQTIIKYCALHNIPIKTIDKTSGILYSERAGAPVEWFDCGVVTGRIAGPLRVSTTSAQFNIYVRNESDTTIVTINLIGYNYDNICYSTGFMEKDLLEFIKTELK